jgi:hypothetical protein
VGSVEVVRTPGVFLDLAFAFGFAAPAAAAVAVADRFVGARR